MLFDSHSHISDHVFDDCRDELIAEMRESGISFVMDIGSSLSTSDDSVRMAEALDFCYAAVGVHPSEVEEMSEEGLLHIKELFIKHPKVRAIGEIGLDYHYDDGPDHELQKYWFKRQAELAVELCAPIVIHEREAFADTFEILKECGAFEKTRVLFHCFSGSAETAAMLVKLGCRIGICGPVTFKNARKPVEVCERIDIDSLLIETDCPYMAPVPMRGKTNKPPYVRYTCEKLAEIKGISFEEAAQATCCNARMFFAI